MTMKSKILKDGRAYHALMEFANLPMNGKMTALTDVGDGEAFVQRMRVRMSRMRGLVKKANLNIAQFRMEHAGTKQVMVQGIAHDEVTIKKASNGLTDMEELLEKIEPLKGLVSGGQRK